MKNLLCMMLICMLALTGLAVFDAAPAMAQQCNVQSNSATSASSAANLQTLQNQILGLSLQQPAALSAVQTSPGLTAVQQQQLLSLFAAQAQPRLAVAAPVVAAPGASASAFAGTTAAVPQPNLSLLSLLAAPQAQALAVPVAVAGCGAGGCARAGLLSGIRARRGSVSRSRSVSVSRTN